ncbi:MAG: hypothetical protein KJN89_00950 [Gammaproteobacteria bacterium]|nr:hypothetical protein [Gammaproteobacteria bacterium]MBT8134425.1 hypothetical protein [Gammaproteobacteria bacterium]
MAGGMFSLLMIMVSPVKADDGSSLYPVQEIAEKSNPWALPQQQERRPGYQQQPYRGQTQPDDSRGPSQPSHQWQPPRDRFVTPSFLESLKKQQQQYQVMPENRQQPQGGRNPWRSGPSLPGQGAYGYPSYGSGTVNPLYDAPAVSPWGDGADVLLRGESFPMVPSEALGGLPPMHVPSFGMKNFKNSESEEPSEVYEGNVFNPFTFLPD